MHNRSDKGWTEMEISFAPEPQPTSHARAFVAVGVLVMSATILLLVIGGAGDRPAELEGVQPAAAASVELLSMQHVRDRASIVVSGLVRNSGASPTRALTVVVTAFDRDGRLAARQESPLAPRILGPGKETSFRVAVPYASDLERYRLGFVTGDQVVPHVDRRAGLTRRAAVTH
jgi:hypothetical protein